MSISRILLFFLGWMGLLCSQSLHAQQKTMLNGVVSSEKGELLYGVSISITVDGSKDKQSGTTNEKGAFSINTLKPGVKYNLLFSYVGYQPYLLKSFSLKADAENSLIIRMKESPSNLNDIVVIGYGSMKKKDLTGAVGSIKSDKITEVAATDATQILQGRISGVLVTQQTWKPGNPAVVRIRGNRSITGSNEPLYVVDGIPFTDAITQISPNDIESMEVLKDASATAIYGNRGANGVILITTKKGKKGKTTVEYNGYYGIQENQPMPELMDAAAFVEYSREAQRNSLGGVYNATPSKELDLKNEQLVATPYMLANMEAAWASGTYDPSQLKSTDWLSYGLRQGVMQDHQVAVRGASETSSFFLSGEYFNNSGVVKDQDYTRYSVRLNADHEIRKGIKIGTQTVYSNNVQNAGWADVFTTYGLKSFNPLATPYGEDGKLVLFPTNNTRTPNPVTNFGNTKRLRKSDRFLGNYYTDITFLKDFNLRTNFGVDYRNFQNYDFNSANTAAAGGEAPASAANGGGKRFMYTLENILSYNKSFGDHSLYATLVQSVQSEQREAYNISVKDLPYEEQLYYNVGTALTINGVSSGYSKWSMASFMGRINYNYKGKYMATASARYDGSSVLAEGGKWVMFPSVALAWRVKNEAFLEDVSFLNDLKLRFGWGKTGNAGVQPYKTQGKLNTVRYVFGEASQLGFTPSEMINPALTWETTGQYNIGLDFAILKSRIAGSLEIYSQTTSNLLLMRQLPTVSGFPDILSNIGKTRSKGVDLTINTLNYANKDFEWRSDWIFSANKQEILRLYNGAKDDIANKWFIGKPVGVLYDLGFNGIWQNTEADKVAMAEYNKNGATFKPGDVRPLDRQNDFKIDANDRYIIGQTDPKWTASWGNNFRYRNFDASVFVYAMVGHMIEHNLDMRFDGRYNQPKLNYWTPDNPSNEYPRPLLGTAGLNYLSTLNYYDGSFLRVKNISLGYSLPKPLLNKMTIDRFRVYASVQNPFLFTKFPGTDPEGASGFSEPSATTYLLGVNLTL